MSAIADGISMLKRRLGLDPGQGDSLRSRLVIGAGGTVALNVGAVGIIFLISVLLARLLGTDGYGSYSYALSWVRLFGVVAIFGFDRLLIKDLSAYRVGRDWGSMRGLLRRTGGISLCSALALAVSAAAVGWLFQRPADGILREAFFAGLIILPVFTLLALRRSALQGLHRVVLGQVPETLIQPLVFISMLGVAYLSFSDSITAPLALGLYAVAAFVAMVFGSVFLRRDLPPEVKTASPVYHTRRWIVGAVPLMLISGMMVINSNVDILMLGSMSGPADAGVYTVATRGAGLVTFVLMAVEAAIGPSIARLYAEGDQVRLQRMLTISARAIFIGSLPVALALMGFGQWFLILFGGGFTTGWAAMNILCIGRLINAATGSAGLVLAMTGHQADSARAIAFSSALNVILNYLLIPHYGVEGAAAATSISMACTNVALLYFVYRRLGLNASGFGRIANA